MSLNINNLKVSVENKEIIKGLNLVINPGEVHVIMGPNGSGKSTLANVLAGHPKYKVTEGEINLDGKNIIGAKVEERAKMGLFLSMQYPPEIEGVTYTTFLRMAYNNLHAQKINPLEFQKTIQHKMKDLGMDEKFGQRYLNVGFSGGEKKKAEILQLSVLEPMYAILDETDSGLDVDALKVVAEGINRFRSKDRAILLVTHYNRILEYVVPDFVHIMVDGQIVKSGGRELAEEIERTGYEGI